MIYIPMLKTRAEEYSVLTKMSDCFSDKIIPLIEIISETYQVRYKIDAETGEYIREKKGKRYMKIKEKPIEADCVTLIMINERLNNKKVFIDYFRFSNKVYGNNVDISRAELSWRVSNNSELYKTKLKEIAKYPNMIPVISIKNSFAMSRKELLRLVVEIQAECSSIALRITEEWMDQYSSIIIEQMRSEDYLLLDIAEQNPRFKFMEIEQMIDMNTCASLVLLNSPRKREINNGSFPVHGITDLIDNCAKDVAEEYNITGYGDYCGITDKMPLSGGSNGTGAALALFYDYRINKFYSYCNHDTSLGMRGYKTVVSAILSDQTILDPQGDCPGYRNVEEMTGTGSWRTWHNINMTRYIHQTYKYL